MLFNKRKQCLGGLVALSLATSTLLTGFTYEGLGEAYYESKMNVGPSVIYTEQLAGHPVRGIQHAYTLQLDTVGGIVKPYVFSGEITGKYTMSNMIKWAQDGGLKVIGGINGDLYDTASGAPKGLTISDGKIKSSGYAPEAVLAFGEDGSAYTAYASLGYNLKVTTTTMVPQAQPSAQGQEQAPVNPAEMVSVTAQQDANINFFNIPHGAANGLHLFNRQYASSTKTTKNSVEVILTAADSLSAQPFVGGTITATVTEVRPSTKNTPMAENQLVLSTVVGSASSAMLASLVPGSAVEISVADQTAGAILTKAKNAIGVYHIIASGGQVTTTDTVIHPRTCVGIKPDGSIMLYAVDARQAGYAEGMTMVDVAKYLVSQGCSAVVNLDGGGSTTMAVRTPGKNNLPTVINKPSDGGKQRAVSNGILLVYTGNGSGTAENLHVYPNKTLMMPKSSMQLNAYATDNLYENVAMPGTPIYTVGEGGGTFSGNGLFTAGEKAGAYSIGVSAGSAKGTAAVDIIDDVTYSLSTSKVVIEPGKSIDINVNPVHGFAKVIGADHLFTWECDPSLGTVDANGVFTAASKGNGLTGTIYVKYNTRVAEVSVTVGSAPHFTDIKGHWAETYINSLATKGIITGVNANTFDPQGQLTRAQILTLLAKIMPDVNVYAAKDAGFTDVKAGEWYTAYVNWGVESGIVTGMGDGTFAPNSPVTREQMTLMINNFAKYAGMEFADTTMLLTFADKANISSWATDSVKKVVAAGIMNGKDSNLFDPSGTANRAEASKVIYQVADILEKQPKKEAAQ